MSIYVTNKNSKHSILPLANCIVFSDGELRSPSIEFEQQK